MRIWICLIIYSCLSDADKKGLEDENDTAVDENQDNEHTVFLKDVLPKEEYKVVEEEQKKTKMEEKLKNAGKRKKRGRVVGGTAVRSNTAFPEYVALKKPYGHHYCGGTILDSNHILTAAHCKPGEFDKIIAGTIERSGADGSSHHFEKCTKHPQAKKGKSVWDADYEICKLKSPLALDGKTKKAVQLGTTAEFNQYVKTGKASCRIVGMGKAGAGGSKKYEPKLQKLSMKVVAYASMMGHFVPQSWGVITQSTEGSGKGGCNGDSGGPFFCNINGVRKQFGVASFADTKCGILTGWYQPAPVINWIQQNSDYVAGSPMKGSDDSSSRNSSKSYSRKTADNKYQRYRQQKLEQNSQQNRNNKYPQNRQDYQKKQKPTSSNNSYKSDSDLNSQGSIAQLKLVKNEFQKLGSRIRSPKLRSQFDQIIALL